MIAPRVPDPDAGGASLHAPSSSEGEDSLRPQVPSLRRRLLLGLLLPMMTLLLVNAVLLYRQALQAANTAYDRTLLASAKAIGEQLQAVTLRDGSIQIQATLPYSSLEAFEADNRSRMVYRVTGPDGRHVSGYEDLPVWGGRLPAQGLYAALVDFYDDRFQDRSVRVAVLLQPVSGPTGQGMATVQVAETLELRQTLARALLLDMVWRELLLLLLMAGIVVWAVQRSTQPVREIGEQLRLRPENDLSPLPADLAPPELRPLMDAANQHMQRLDHLLKHQKQFVRDASHQLRTPLAVLKAQVQSARRGDWPMSQALMEMERTVDDAVELANQMLALAKAEQLQHAKSLSAADELPLSDWAAIVKKVALDLAPLTTEKELDFGVAVPDTPIWVRGHEWTLKELTRNLLHNAIQHSPSRGVLDVCLRTMDAHHELLISDQGPGISETTQQLLFHSLDLHSPMRSTGPLPSSKGAGLGLTICLRLVQSLNGHLYLLNRPSLLNPSIEAAGLDAKVQLPVSQPG